MKSDESSRTSTVFRTVEEIRQLVCTPAAAERLQFAGD